jgi:signal transduction histidine kinase
LRAVEYLRISLESLRGKEPLRVSSIEPFTLLKPWLDGLDRGLILFGPSGDGLYANTRAQDWLGPPAAQATLAGLPHLLKAAGFEPDAGRAPRWSRGSLVMELTLEPTAQGATLVWLDEVSQAVGQRLRFLSVASHDLRGALANARSFASLLLHPKWNLETRVRHGLEVMVRNLDRGMGMATDVFDALRSDLLPLDVDIQEQSLVPLLNGVAERAREAATSQEVGFEVQVDRAPATWPTDGTRLAHALDGLVEHALGRTPPHGVCRLEVSCAGDRLSFRVEDSGPPPESLEGLFERDARVAQTVKLDGGFRLALARAEAHALGGSLEAELSRTGGLALVLTLNRIAAGALASPPAF